MPTEWSCRCWPTLGAKRSAVMGERAGALRVAVTDPPEKGKANAAIQAVLAEVCACSAQQIALLAGQTSRQKRFLIEGVAPEDLHDRLARVIAAAASKRSHA